jgi:hypothetical protein
MHADAIISPEFEALADAVPIDQHRMINGVSVTACGKEAAAEDVVTMVGEQAVIAMHAESIRSCPAHRFDSDHLETDWRPPRRFAEEFRPNFASARLRHHHHRAMRHTDHFLGDAAEHQTR